MEVSGFGSVLVAVACGGEEMILQLGRICYDKYVPRHTSTRAAFHKRIKEGGRA